MRTIDSQAVPQAPSLIESLRAGFDAIANHLELILFPVLLDLLLWLGPHLPMTRVIRSFSDFMVQSVAQEPRMIDSIRMYQEAWELIAERFNLLLLLRSFPVGIPSLMAFRWPVQTPAWLPAQLEITSALLGPALWLALTGIGIIAGALYFTAVSQAALSGMVSWREVIDRWPRTSWQVLLLTLIWLGLMLVAAIPGTFIMALATLSGLGVYCAGLLYTSFLVWLIFPLLFSAHGIFVNDTGAVHSMRSSTLMTRYTLPSTAMFVAISIVLSMVLNYYAWQAPAETSWWTLVGIAGHAFVTTGFLAASFIYYRDADIWAQSLVRHIKFSAIHKT